MEIWGRVRVVGLEPVGQFGRAPLGSRAGAGESVITAGPCSEPFASGPRSDFRAEVTQKKREALLGGEDAVEHSEEHRLLMAWNDAENARQRARREERIRKEEEERKKQKLQAAENKAKLTEAFLKEKEKEVLQLQEEAKKFITPENLDARIEECLDNPRNYNFAIDKEGRIVRRTVLS
nr:PREDICTED: 28S ribosomal protein S26, mitochondrial [Apteryx mantelli mantelli]